MTDEPKFAAQQVMPGSPIRPLLHVPASRGIPFCQRLVRARGFNALSPLRLRLNGIGADKSVPHWSGFIGQPHRMIGRLTAVGIQSDYVPGRASKSRPACFSRRRAMPIRSRACPPYLNPKWRGGAPPFLPCMFRLRSLGVLRRSVCGVQPCREISLSRCRSDKASRVSTPGPGGPLIRS